MLHLNKAIELAPRRANFYCGRGWAKERMTAFDEALSDYNNAIKLDPSEYCGYYNRAFFYLDKGDSAQAVKDLQRALELTDNKQTREGIERELQRLQADSQPKRAKPPLSNERNSP
jgi:Flp pilus assembly protein TadD